MNGINIIATATNPNIFIAIFGIGIGILLTIVGIFLICFSYKGNYGITCLFLSIAVTILTLIIDVVSIKALIDCLKNPAYICTLSDTINYSEFMMKYRIIARQGEFYKIIRRY